MVKKEYERIQLLASQDIFKWWGALQDADKANGTKLAQERLREAVRIGIEVLEGRLGTVAPEKKSIYDALETLLRTGVLSPNSSAQESPQAQPASVQKKPKLGRTRDAYAEYRK